MINIKTILALVVFLFQSASIFSQTAAGKLDSLLNGKTKKILVAAHRGDWRNAPENSLQAFRNCISRGIEIIELDLKMTRDSQLIVMHDGTLDRTTTSKGRCSDYTLTEIKALKLRNGIGVATTHTVPLFEEALKEVGQKAIIDIDKGYEYLGLVLETLHRTNALNRVIINIRENISYDEVLKEHPDIPETAVLMPVINLSKPEAGAITQSYLRRKNTIYQFVFPSDTLQSLEIIKEVDAEGGVIWINSLWATLCGGHNDDVAVEEGKAEESWGWIVRYYADVIQSDRPFDLSNYLKSKFK